MERIVMRKRGGRAASHFRRIVIREEGGPEFTRNVETNEMHSHAKLCYEAVVNGPGFSPQLDGAEPKSLGEGLLMLLAVAPAANIVNLATMVVGSGMFPPLRWEVCASQKVTKPLSLAVTPASDAIGSWLHSDWIYPASLDRERKELVVPLYAKIGAVYIYTLEEKEIFDNAAVQLMTIQTAGTASSKEERGRRWKFCGFGYGGPVAMCCVLLMPSNMVDSLVTFGSPPCFSHPDGLLPFPHSHVQHSLDITPHCCNAKLLPKLLARLKGMGYIFPQSPLQRLNGGTNKSLYSHPVNHVQILYPAQNSYAHGVANYVDGGGVPVIPQASQAPRSKQDREVPKLEFEARTTHPDLRIMHTNVKLREYFAAFRLLLQKKLEGMVITAVPDSHEILAKFLNPVGEFHNRKIAADVVALFNPPPDPSVSSPVIDFGEEAASPTAKKNVKGKTKSQKDVQSDAQTTFAEQITLMYPKLVSVFLEKRADGFPVQFPTMEVHPPLIISMQMEVCGDTPENLIPFFKQFMGVASWEARIVARQLLDWGGSPPLIHSAAAAFVSTHWMLYLCSSAPRRAPLSRHISTAQTLSGMDEQSRAMLSSPDGYHLGWTIAIISTVQTVGKSTLISTLRQEPLQSSALQLPRELIVETEDGLIIPVRENFMKLKWAPMTYSNVNQNAPANVYGGKRIWALGMDGQPNALLFKLTLEEMHWTRHSTMQHLKFAAQCVFLVCDAYTFDHFIQTIDLARDIPPGAIAAMLYCPRRGAEPNLVLEGAIAKYCAIHRIPYAAVDIKDANSCTAFQRLCVQWMIPKLHLPVDPVLLPPGVEVGALFTKCDKAIAEYLSRTVTLGSAPIEEDEEFVFMDLEEGQLGFDAPPPPPVINEDDAAKDKSPTRSDSMLKGSLSRKSSLNRKESMLNRKGSMLKKDPSPRKESVAKRESIAEAPPVEKNAQE